jgi:uncharacterized membrane protein YeaQ/YmgE (transglycosylase-associated protein family)
MNMSLLAWIVFGLAVGIVANAIDPKPSYGGIIGAVVFGTAGALVGGFLTSLFLGLEIGGFNFISVTIALAAAFGMLMLIRSVRRAGS